MECVRLVESFEHFSDGPESQIKTYIAKRIRSKYPAAFSRVSAQEAMSADRGTSFDELLDQAQFVQRELEKLLSDSRAENTHLRAALAHADRYCGIDHTKSAAEGELEPPAKEQK